MLRTIISGIDAVSTLVAKWSKWIIMIVVFEMFYEVCARYFFNRPTIWSYDLSYMLGGAFFTLGLCYVHRLDRHVRVDVFYTMFSPRAKAIIDIVMSLLIFFPTFSMLIVKMFPYVVTSWQRGEKAVGSFWGPPIYPLKTVVLMAIILLWLQGLSNFLKDVQILAGKTREEVGK